MAAKKKTAKTETKPEAAHTHSKPVLNADEAAKGRDNGEEIVPPVVKIAAEKTEVLVRDTEEVDTGVKHDPPYSANVALSEVSNWLDARYPKIHGDPRSGATMGWRRK